MFAAVNSTIKPSRLNTLRAMDPLVLRRRAEKVMIFLMVWVVVDLFLLGSIALLHKNWFWFATLWLVFFAIVAGGIFLRLFQRYEQDTTAWHQAAARAQAEHEQLGELLRSFFETTPDALTVKDAEGRYLQCNTSALRMLGRKEFDFRGQMDEVLLPAELAALRRTIDLRIINGESVIVFEETVALSDRGQTTWQVSVNALRDTASGALRVIFASYKDITERKVLEERMRESEECFSTFFRGRAVGAIIGDVPTGALVELNDTFAHMLGYHRDELVGRSTLELGIWVDPAARLELANQLADFNQIGQCEAQLRRKDGSIIDVLIQGEMVQLRTARYFMGTLADISAIKAAQLALRQKEQQYRALFENLLAGAAYGVIVDTAQSSPDIMLVEVNHRLEELLGRTALSLTGRPLQQVFPDLPETNPELYERVMRIAAHGGSSERFQSWLPQTNRWLEFCVFSGNAASYIITADDITERRRYEDEILRLNDQLKQRVGEQTHLLEGAVQDMETFIYTVSTRLFEALQEVKTDLRNCWLDVPPEHNFSHQVERTLRSTRHMKTLLEGAVAYMCASTLPIDTELVDVRGIVQRLCDEAAQRQPNIEFRVLLLPQITGVPLIIHTIFHNLLENACKFSATRDRPEIEIGVMQGIDTTIYIKDNGIGFPQADAHRLFQPYELLHTQEEPGAGIGLTMTRRLVERHGGVIWAKSVEGEGATFFVTLGPPPLAATDGTEPLFEHRKHQLH